MKKGIYPAYTIWFETAQTLTEFPPKLALDKEADLVTI
jgi:hypothetical protein